MNCRQFHKAIRVSAFEEPNCSRAGEELQIHAGRCFSCRQLLTDVRELDAAISLLRSESELESTPASVEQALRRALRSTGRSRTAAGVRASFARPLAAAALALVAALSVALWGGRTNLENAPPAETALSDGPELEAGNYVVETPTDFIPLDGCAGRDCWEEAQLVRVQLPRSSLGYYGLPMDISRIGEQVPADVLMGMDGVPRAIRFVHYADQPQ